MSTEHYRKELTRIIAGRKWISAFHVQIASYRVAEALEDLGAENVFRLGASRGAGDLSEVPDTLSHMMKTPEHASTMQNIRAAMQSFKDLDPVARAKIDTWDPAHSAMAITTIFSDDQPIHGRPVWGRRLPEWQALENKMTCDALWDAAGIVRSVADIGPVESTRLINVHHRLNQGLGTVWVGDNKEGWHGGGEYLRWIRNNEDLSAALEFFGQHCDRVRVQPFMDGIPCSIHGMVFPDAVIAFRPCEMLIYRQEGSSRLVYGAAATLWDPSPVDREAMREVARVTGRHLRETVDYRGVFTVDGIMTSEGFRPTEINPRYGAAISRMMKGLAGLPLYLLHRAVCANEPVDYQPEMLERMVVEAADSNRIISGGFMIAGFSPAEDLVVDLQRTDSGWQKSDTKSDAWARIGRVPNGSRLWLHIDASCLPVGESAAPYVAEIVHLTDELWGHGLHGLQSAPEIRNQ